VEGLRNLTISSPPGPPMDLTIKPFEEGVAPPCAVGVPALSMVEGPPWVDPDPEVPEDSSFSPDESSDSGYFLKSSKKTSTGGLGKSLSPARNRRGRKSNIHKAQSRARMDLVEGKQISIEKALRAGKGRKKGRK